MRKSAMASMVRKGFFVGGLALLSAACATNPAPQVQPIAAPVTPAAPVLVLGDLLGADARAVDGMLGAPALSRREGAGEYRRYPLSTCTLIIILYPDDKGTSHVAHVDTTAQHSGGDKPDLEKCLAAG